MNQVAAVAAQQHKKEPLISRLFKHLKQDCYLVCVCIIPHKKEDKIKISKSDKTETDCAFFVSFTIEAYLPVL